MLRTPTRRQPSASLMVPSTTALRKVMALAPTAGAHAALKLLLPAGEAECKERAYGARSRSPGGACSPTANPATNVRMPLAHASQ